MATLQDSLGHLSPAKREIVRRRLAALNAGAASASAATAIPRAARDRDLPLSFAQQRLWFVERLEGPGALYNEFAGEVIDGALNVAALESALAGILQRHEILRSVFVEIDGTPVQRIHDTIDLPLTVIDLQHLAPAERDAEVRRLSDAEARRPFDLAAGPLARFVLLKLAPEQHVVLLSMHHIVCDKWSTAVFVREVSQLYADFVAGEPSSLPPLPLQYADYAAWQRAQMETAEAAEELRAWVDALAGAPLLLDLPSDRPRPQVQSSAGGTVRFGLDESVTALLNRRSRELGVTPFMLLHAALVALIYRYTARRDVVIGAPVANREHAATEGLIGFFVNTLPLRVTFDPSRSFADLTAAVRRADADAFARRQTPLERIVQEVQPERSLAHSPLFQVLFAFQNAPVETPRIPHLRLSTFRSDCVAAKFDLTVVLAEEHGCITGAFEYSTDLFDRDRIERMTRHFETLLGEALAAPSTRVDALEVLPREERHSLAVWSEARDAVRGTSDDAGWRPLHEVFSLHARQLPDAVAVEWGGARITYANLDADSNRFASYLRAQGVGPEVLVGLSLDRSIDLVVALLGIHKAGGAYLPLDPTYPRERLEYMLSDSGAAFVIGTRQTLFTLPAATGVRRICLDDQRPQIEAQALLDELPRVTPTTRAYVIYTSGSTGRPKGVELQHGGLMNLARAQRVAFAVDAGSRVLQFASLNFDASISEIGMALCCGATLVLGASEQLTPGHDLQRMLVDAAVTHVTLPPSALPLMDPARLPALATLIVAGEACSAAVAKPWVAGRSVVNAYGPTETTVCATVCHYDGEGPLTIGRPIAGVRVAVVDGDGNLAPIGVPGELYIGGVGVGRGYVGRPDLTADKFVPDPWSTAPGARLYRSGDLARVTPRGDIEFLGRIDHQVKVRGFRIELEEVAHALHRHPAVRQCVVTAIDREGDRRLAAYYVAHCDESGKTSASELRGFLSRTLPDYMIPSLFVRLDALPLTPAGKIDRTQLPVPEAAAGTAPAARDGIEEVIAQLWRQLLGVGDASLDANFFDVGGHSLLAVQLIARVRDTWGVEVGLREFFASPNARELARLVRDRVRARVGNALPPITAVDRNLPIPLSFAQQRLWFLDQLEGPSSTYNIAVALRLAGVIDVAALGCAFREIVERHESLRTTFPLLDGVPVQRIGAVPSEVLVVDPATHVPAGARLAAMHAASREEAERPFNLAEGPLLRARLCAFAPDDHLLLVTMHHIVSDGWSMAILIRDLIAVYRAQRGELPSVLPVLPIQYADFAAWQRRWLSGERLERELAFWRSQLADAPALLDLPTDHARPPVRSTRGRLVRFTLGGDLTDRLRALGAGSGATLFMTLMAGFVAVLSRYGREDDIVIGSGMANRNHSDTESLVGFFVNTLVLRTDLSGNPSFVELLRRVRGVALDAYAHQDVPFEKLVEALQPERSLSHTPLFQVMFALQNVPSGELQIPGVAVTPLEPETATAKFDLTVFLEAQGRGVSGAVVYSTDLFDEASVTRLFRYYVNFLTAAASASECAIAALPLMDDAEIGTLVRALSSSGRAGVPQTLDERFQQVARACPERIAVTLGERHLCYDELNRRANRLARHLRSLGVGRDVRVALCLERSPELIVALVAIVKAGGAYVPLDPSSPRERLAYLVEDCGAAALVTSESLLPSLPQVTVPMCCIDRDWPSIATGADDDLPPSARIDDLCYVIYTSGSTGQPKGTLVTHRNVSRLFDATAQWFAFDDHDTWTLFHSPAFDFSVWEIWGPLLYGGRLVVVPYLTSRSPSEFYHLLRRERVTVLNQTPSAFSQLVDADRELFDPSMPLALRYVVFGGEALDLRSLRPWVDRHGDKRPRLVNMYGITETTVHVTWRPIRARDLERPRSVIGRAISDLSLYVLDDHMNPVPPGVPGELYVGGDGLARGYLNRPDLTAERFVPNPFTAEGATRETRLYRTGDVVRLASDDELEYVGRTDHQVKIRGFRVEPGEIEASIARHAAVQDVVVLARHDGGGQRLVAYVVPDQRCARPVLRLLASQRDQRSGPELFELPNGMVIAHLNRMETEFVYREIFEQQSYLRHGVTLADEAVVVDVGANIGLFSLFVAAQVPNARVYAFEPIPETFDCLRRNIELHDIDARLFACGLADGERTETFTFYPNVSIISGRFGDVEAEKRMVRAYLLAHASSENAAGGVRIGDSGQDSALPVAPQLIDELLDERLQRQTVACRLRRLSDVIAEERIDTIDLLKIDVEKSELDVLGGIDDADWRRIRQVIVEVHGSDGRLERVTSLLVQHGFRVTVQGDELLANAELFNVYATRDQECAADANRRAAPPAAVWRSPAALVADLREHAERLLPPYMVPSVVLLDRFPLTVNGKLDRRALPDAQQTRALVVRTLQPPRTATEAQLAAIFREVLRLQAIGTDENFFAAGGHSLLATQVVSRVRDTFRVELPLQTLFQSPTVAALAAVLDERTPPVASPQGSIRPRRSAAGTQLSFAQERLWFLDQLEPGNPFYNVALALRLQGALDVGVLERSLDEIVRRHEVLRSVFVSVDGKPRQVVRAPGAPRDRLSDTIIDLTPFAGDDRQRRLDAFLRDEATRPFDLGADPLLRARLVRTADEDWTLALTMHHIVCDGWSLGVLVNELGSLYDAFASGRPSPLPEPPLQYADYAEWQRDWLTGGNLESHLAFWSRQLAGAPPVLQLPADRPRPPTQTFRGDNYRFAIGNELTSGLRELARAHDATLFMTLLSVFIAVLHRYTGQDDIVVGAPIANRTRREVEPLIGFFVNTLALRASVAADPSFATLLQRMRAVTLDAYAHQDLPFERLVDELHAERDLSLNPLFQVMCSLQNAPLAPLALTGLRVEALERPSTAALFDVVLDFWEVDDHVVANLQFNTDLFDRDTMVRFADHLLEMARAVVAAPALPLSLVSFVPAAECAAVLAAGRGAHAAYAIDEPLSVHVEATARATPDAVAVRHNGVSTTYATLNSQANRMAWWLRDAGVGRGDFVGVLDRRGTDLIAAMLGIGKAGGAFLLLDPEYPAERLRFMLDDSGVRTLISRQSVLAGIGDLAPRANGGALRVLDLDDGSLQTCGDSNPPAGCTGRDIAYLLYTSGSTGVPKGALVRHDGALNHIFAERDLLRLHAGTTFLQSAPCSSDIAVWQCVAPALIGGQVVIADYDVVCDAERLLALLQAERVTLFELVPVVLKALLDHAASLPPDDRRLPALQRAMVTGEAAPVALVNQWFELYPDIPLVNAYGPTEAADDISQYEMTAALPALALTVPIGQPLPNLRLYVLDHQRQLVPFGVTGEICVSGIGVGAGYWRQPVRTATTFIANPYAEGPHDTVLYRTGDRGRWRADGVLECVGRLDEQVKIRGFRIEPGEIEATLARHPAVRAAAVAARPDDAGAARLVAYIVADASAPDVLRQTESLQGEQIALWRRLHEDSYTGRLLRQDDPTFNVIGWDSNYTNTPLPEADMREYVDFTVERIRALEPRRVLEIGCGTGLILFKLVPHCESYCGTDVSQVAVRQLRELQRDAGLRQRIPGLERVTLRQQRADEIAVAPDEAVDTVLLPSVVQYFPSVDYLLRVIERVLGFLAPGGSIFIGDVRSLPLLEAFHLSVQLHKSRGEASVAELATRVRQQLEREQELAIDPRFFPALAARFPQIASVEVLPKRGTCQNEMTRFRFDVRIHTSPSAPRARPTVSRVEQWDASWTMDRIGATLAAGARQPWVLRNVANSRLAREAAALAWLRDGLAAGTVHEMRTRLSRTAECGLEPENLWALEREGSWRVELSMAAGRLDGAFDALFVPASSELAPGTFPFAEAPPAEVAWRAYGNDPLAEKLRRGLTSALRDHLRGCVPQYMVPGDFVFLGALPLTPAGKVDRAALPQPATVQGIGDSSYVAPRTREEEALCRIWSDVLDLEQVGIRANFFELGGHSLKATQVVSRILRDLEVQVPLREIFVAPTIEELAERVRGASRAEYRAIPRAPAADWYPLSHAQRRLWVLCQIDGAAAAYNIPGAVVLEGAVDETALQRSLDLLIARHESLRTAFAAIDGSPQQRISNDIERPLTRIDLTAHPAPEDEARRLAIEDAHTPFTLEDGGLIRASLLRMRPGRHVLLFNMHHIVSDDWSGGVLVREFLQLYAGVLRGDRNPGDALPELPIQYRDYALWQNAELEREPTETHRKYWLEQLAGELPVLDLPTDLPRPAVKTYAGRTHSFSLSDDDTAAVMAAARAHAASPFMMLVALVKTLLFRYTHQADSIVGFPIAGRTQPELEHQIGFFINMLPLRDRLDGQMSFATLLQQVKRTATEAYEHQQYPYDRIVNELDVNRDVSRTPLFDVVVVLQNADVTPLTLPGISVTPLLVEYGFSKFDLTFAFEERGSQLHCDVVYNTDLFFDDRIRRMGEHFIQLVRVVTADSSALLAEIDILPASEREKVLVAWPSGRQRMPANAVVPLTSLVQAFEAAADRFPHRVAVTLPHGAAAAGETARHITYAELNAAANRVAHQLRRHGVQRGAFVALCTERSVGMIAGILGILKAGGAYVPLDPTYPRERMRFILEDTAATVIVTEEHLAAGLPATAASLVCVSGERQDDLSDANPCVRIEPEDGAYVIYTSGSTGQPKGVLVSHHNVCRLLASTESWFGFNEEDVWTLFHSYAFDFSVWELWGALLYGGRLVIVPREIARAPADFHALACREHVTVLNQTPSAFAQFMVAALERGSAGELRYVIFGGEALDVPALASWFDAFGDAQPRLINMYGITETTVHVTFRPLSRADAERPASVIGVPLPDLRLYVLDPWRRAVAIGVRGELYVGGAGLAHGYINRPELTAERFVVQGEADHRTGGPPPQRLYRTGDLARFLDDGDVEYLGRADQQVKIRGFRVEPGEIEAALAEHPGVARVVVVARRDADSTRLVAYLVPRGDAPEPSALRAHLQQRVPEYMVPSAFVALPAFPLTANGKLDRDRLPDPDDQRRGPQPFVAPQTSTEQAIAGIMAAVLKTERLGLHDNFFDAGADSLLLALAHTRIREALGAELSLVALYQHPTVSTLAASLSGGPSSDHVMRSVEERATRQRQAQRLRRKA